MFEDQDKLKVAVKVAIPKLSPRDTATMVSPQSLTQSSSWASLGEEDTVVECMNTSLPGSFSGRLDQFIQDGRHEHSINHPGSSSTMPNIVVSQTQQAEIPEHGYALHGSRTCRPIFHPKMSSVFSALK